MLFDMRACFCAWLCLAVASFTGHAPLGAAIGSPRGLRGPRRLQDDGKKKDEGVDGDVVEDEGEGDVDGDPEEGGLQTGSQTASPTTEFVPCGSIGRSTSMEE